MALLNNTVSLLVEQFISEGILDRVKEKFAESGVEPEDIDYMSKNDPSKRNKYLEWMVLQLAKDDDLDHDYTIEIVDEFHKLAKNLERKDINQYSDPKDLALALRQYHSSQGLKRAQKRHKKYVNLKPGTRVVHKDEKLVILNPTTKESVCHYGAGTKWCITEEDQEHFEEYSRQNIVFYYVFDLTRQSKDPLYKVAYAVYRDSGNSVEKIEIFDAQDDEIEEEDVFDKEDDPDVALAIRRIITKDAESQDWTSEARESFIRDELDEELNNILHEFDGNSEIWNSNYEGPEEYDGNYEFRVDLSGYIPLTDSYYLGNLSIDVEQYINIIREMSHHVLAKHIEDAMDDISLSSVDITDNGSELVAYVSYSDYDGSLTGYDSIDEIRRGLDYIESNTPKIEQIILRLEKELIESGDIENWLGADDLEALNLENVEVEKDFDDEVGNTLEVEFDLGKFPTGTRYSDEDIKYALERVAKFKYAQLKFAFSDEESLEELPEMPQITITKSTWGVKDGFKLVGKFIISGESMAKELQFWAKFVNDNIEDVRSVTKNIIENY